MRFFTLARIIVITFFLAPVVCLAVDFADFSATVSYGGSNPTNTDPIVFTVTFGAPITATSFIDTDVSTTGTTAPGALTISVTEVAPNDGTTFEVSVSGMTGDGDVVISIPAGSVTDGTDTNLVSNNENVTYDGTQPNVTIEKKVSQADPTNASPILFTVTFDEDIVPGSFTAADINLSAHTLGGTAVLTPSVSVVTPNTVFEVSVAITGTPVSGNVIASINASKVVDPAGNGNTASTSTDNTVAYDITGPTVTINKKIGQSDPTNVSPILFTVTFNEQINAGTFVAGDINLSASTLGGGATLTPSISVVTPNTVFEVSVAITGSPVSGDVVASIDAGKVADPLGNTSSASTSTDNIVAYTLLPPTITTPTAASVTENSATLGGNITSDGGSAITERGTVWKASAGVTIADNKLAEGGISTGVFSHSRTSLPSATQIFYATYATNAIGTTLTTESSFYTLAVNPSAHPGSLSATAVSASQINLTFTDPATIGAGTVKGYIILRNSTMNPLVSHINAPNDGVAPASLTFTNGTVLAGTVTSGTTFNDLGLSGSTNYRYLIVPFNVDNVVTPTAATYNYKTDGSPVSPDNAITFSAISNIEYLGSSTSSIDYKNFQTASGLTGGGSPNSVLMGEFEVRDGGSAGSDVDGQTTTLTSLTISISNSANVRTVALFDGSTNLSEQPGGASVTFPSLNIVATDDNDKAFRIRATFNASVTDNQFIQISVTGATASSSGSVFAAANAGGATTGGATNQIEVVASKLIFLSSPTALVNAAFSITVNAVDDPLENTDLDEAGQVNPLKIDPNPNSAVLSTTAEPLTANLVAGTFTWTQLHINLSGVHNLRAYHSLIDAQGPVTITSNGATVSPGSVPLSPVCYNGGFQTLSNIVITESDPSDFALGNNQVFSMVLPAGFIFNTALTPMPTLGNVSGSEMNTPVAASYVGNAIVRVGYNITGTTKINSLTISGLQVKYTGNTPYTGNILRYGGSAVIAGNMDADGKNHGTLTAAPSATPVSFTVDELAGQPVVDPNETRFSINTATVKLIGNPIGGLFTGNGVILSPTNGYTFNPTSVGVGNNYPVVYTYNEPSGQQCQVTATKTFEVYASVIGNLNLQYCTNGTPSTGLNVPQAQIDALYSANPPGTFVLHDFVYYNPSFGYTPIADPNNTTFNPASPDYVQTTSIYGGVYIYYRVHNIATPTTPQFAQYQFVTMNLAPNVSFTLPGGQINFCDDETPVQLIGTPTNSNTTANDFFSATGGQQPSISSAGSPVVWSFSPTAVTGVSPGVSQSFNITYTYKDPYSQCSNTSAPITITVHNRPGAVPEADISPTGTPPTLIACVGGLAGSFNATPISGTTYKWYTDNPPTDLRKIGNDFSPDGLFNSGTAGNTNFYVTRTINGCESAPSPTTIRVTVNPLATVNAGTDQSTCAGTDQLLSAFGASFGGAASSASWTIVSGTGVIKDNLDAPLTLPASFGTAFKYTPSAADIAAGAVILRLTTNDPDGTSGPCSPVFDDVAISITSVAQATALANNQTPLVVCSGDAIILNGIIGGAATSLEWFKGSVSPSNSLGTTPNTQYFPTASELLNGAFISFVLQTDDPAGPCSAVTSTVNVTINQRSIVNAGIDLTKCAYDVIQLNGSIPANSSANSFTWSGGAGSFSPDPNTGNAIYNANSTELNGASLIFTLTSDDADGNGPCPAETDNVLVTINPRPAVPAATQPSDYCVGNTIANLEGFGSNLKWYSDAGLTNQVGVGTSFASGVSNAAETNVPFYVTQTILGCESFSTSVSVVVNPLPVPDFTAVNFCQGDFMAFTDASTVNNGTIALWDWRFDDGLALSPPGTGAVAAGTHGGQTTGTYNNPQHKYISTGSYNIRLTAISDKGCFQSVQKTYNVGPVPKADFYIQNICDQDNTQLTYTGTVPGQITTWAWDFGDAASGTNNTASIQNPSHTFTGVNTYPVTLSVTTNLGCSDIIVKNAYILPYIKTFPYQESFESAGHGWVSEGLNSPPNNTTSWTLGPPAGTIINVAADGTNAWLTRDNVLGTYNNSERSVLYGPCFDMTQLQRPVLSVEYWNNTDPGNDGAYIEYSLNNGVIWQRLGILNEGLEWYNRAAILGLSQQNGVGQAIAQIGWSGNTPSWTAGKYNMDNFGIESKLRLRFVFGSNPDNPSQLDGFGMDNFKIETRNRVILSENFTSAAANGSATNNQNFISFKQSNPNELVKLQYHVDLPEADDINKQNPADPNARAAFYGLTNSNSLVPRIFLDGVSENPGNFVNSMEWANTYYNNRSLVTSPVSIALTTLPTDNNKIALQATVTALNSLTSGKLVLLFAIVEKTVGSDQFIVRKLLPSPTGIPLTLPMVINQSITITPEAWEVKNVNNINELAVMAFVQNLETFDILQTAYLSNPANLPSVVTGVEELTAEGILIYPNPTDSELTIQLPTTARQKIEVKILDPLGKSVHETSIKQGSSTKVIGTQNFPAGIYILQIGNRLEGMVQKKVLVMHDK